MGTITVWEYKMLHGLNTYSSDKAEQTLNDLGAAGWEVISADLYFELVLLKRPK